MSIILQRKKKKKKKKKKKDKRQTNAEMLIIFTSKNVTKSQNLHFPNVPRFKKVKLIMFPNNPKMAKTSRALLHVVPDIILPKPILSISLSTHMD